MNNISENIETVIGVDINDPNALVFDLSEENHELARVDLSDTAAFSAYIFGSMEKQGTEVGFGKYAENRCIYRRSKHFDGTEAERSFHLGLDIWAKAGTPVFSPLAGTVHSFQDNDTYGDYGPTVILSHEIEGEKIHSLYGHLSRESLVGKVVGDSVVAGQTIGALGEPHENVEWPPHLHFQLIKDLGGHRGDYPGVCTVAESERYMANCPNPNLLLDIALLKVAIP